MTFLNPFVLVGLAAAAIPLIIHLLNLRKLKTLEFSSLRFLKELQKTTMRRLRIRQILLLILRTLLIIAVVLAFSRPALRGSMAGMLGSRSATTMVVILDDSPSMAVRNERGVLFNQAKDAARQILALAREGDRVYVLSLSGLRHTGTLSPTPPLNATAVLQSISLSQETFPFGSVLHAAAGIIAGSQNANEEVYLLTDGQASQFSVARADSGTSFDARTRIFLLALASRRQDNTAVSSVDQTSQIVSRGRPVRYRALLRNFGTAGQHNLTVSAYLDGARVAQQSVDIPQDGSAIADFTLIPQRSGILEGYIQSEDDALDIDNKRFFVLNVPSTISILLIAGAPEDSRFASLALGPSGDTTTAAVYAVREIPESQLPSTDLGAYDVLVTCNVRDFATIEADRLEQFIRAGGGLLIFPGPASDLANYNTTLFPRLGIPRVSGPTEMQAPGTFLTFERIDFAHPLFSGLFEQPFGRKAGMPVVESPKVVKAIVPVAGATGRTIIALSNGGGFLTEYSLGTGKVLLFSVEAGLAWSDFPVKGLFAPLLHRSVVYLASQTQTDPGFIAGERLSISAKLKDFNERDVYVLRSPSGNDERVIPTFAPASGVATFETSDAAETGIYGLYIKEGSGGRQKGAAPLRAAAVNVAPSESDLRPADDETLNRFWSALGVQQKQVERLQESASIAQSVGRSRYGVELWKYLVGLAIVLALAEMAVGREPRAHSSSAESP